MPRWLNTIAKSSKRLPDHDAPPVVTSGQGFVHGTIGTNTPIVSIFQSEGQTRNLVRIQDSLHGNLVHFSMMSPPRERNACEAVLRADRQHWIEQAMVNPNWSESRHALHPWTQHLNASLFDMGQGSLCASLRNISFSKSDPAAHVMLHAKGPLVVVSTDGRIDDLTSSYIQAELGLSQHDTPLPQEITIRGLRSLILSSEPIDEDHMTRAIRKMLEIPYPQAAGAELLYFALGSSAPSTLVWIELPS